MSLCNTCPEEIACLNADHECDNLLQDIEDAFHAHCYTECNECKGQLHYESCYDPFKEKYLED